MFLPGPQAQYRLRSAEDYGPQVKFVSNYWVKSTSECKLYQLIILAILMLQSYNDIQFSGYKMTDYIIKSIPKHIYELRVLL